MKCSKEYSEDALGHGSRLPSVCLSGRLSVSLLAVGRHKVGIKPKKTPKSRQRPPQRFGSVPRWVVFSRVRQR